MLDSLDPFGEKNALKVLGLQHGASQEEIKSRYIIRGAVKSFLSEIILNHDSIILK